MDPSNSYIYYKITLKNVYFFTLSFDGIQELCFVLQSYMFSNYAVYTKMYKLLLPLLARSNEDK